MCDKAIEEYLYNMEYVRDKYRPQEMSEKSVNARPEIFEFVPYQ